MPKLQLLLHQPNIWRWRWGDNTKVEKKKGWKKTIAANKIGKGLITHRCGIFKEKKSRQRGKIATSQHRKYKRPNRKSALAAVARRKAGDAVTSCVLSLGKSKRFVRSWRLALRKMGITIQY